MILKIKTLVVILFIVFGCNNKNKSIVIINKSRVNFDSANISLNDYIFKLSNFKANSDRIIKIDESLINANHDVGFSFDFFINDTIVINEYIFSNDLGFIPLVSTFVVNDSLIVKRVIINDSSKNYH